MRVIMLILGLLLCVLNSGCQSTRPQSATADSRLSSIRPALPKNIDAPPKHLAQLVNFNYGERVDSVPFVLEFSSDRLVMTALAGWGTPLFVLSYDGDNIGYLQEPVIATGLRAEYILTDVFLTYWPIALLQPELTNAGLRIEEDLTSRRIYRDSDLLIEISYSQPIHWYATVEFIQLQLGYSLVIQPIESNE